MKVLLFVLLVAATFHLMYAFRTFKSCRTLGNVRYTSGGNIPVKDVISVEKMKDLLFTNSIGEDVKLGNLMGSENLLLFF